jgi:hypothetical protein
MVKQGDVLRVLVGIVVIYCYILQIEKRPPTQQANATLGNKGYSK